MISQIKGWLLEIQDQQLVLDVGGIGYEVEVPLATALTLHNRKDLVQLFTHFVVREESHTLFGFLNRSDRDLFRALIKVNKVGPRLALSILSALDAKGFARLIQLNDIKTLNGIPGVPPMFVETRLNQSRSCPFLRSSDSPFSNSIGKLFPLHKLPWIELKQGLDFIVM